VRTLPSRRLLSLRLLLPLLLPAAGAVAQYRSQDASSAAGAAGCAACGSFLLILIHAVIAIDIALLGWVARDAKSRGMDGAVLWVLLVLFTGIIGLIIYIFARPQGALVPCPNCGNKRLEASLRCPHCGFAS
jgi:ribosomal protein L32